MARSAPWTTLIRTVGPLATNVHVLADPAHPRGDRDRHGDPVASTSSGASSTRAAGPSRFIVSTHGHWDHIGDNAALAAHTGAEIAVHPLDRERLQHPSRGMAPFEIPPSVAGGRAGRGRHDPVRRRCASTCSTRPGHTEGSVCLLARDEGLLFSGDTLFAGGWGRVDLPGRLGGADGVIARRASRGLEDHVRVFPGHGPATTIGRERAWLDLVVREGRLLRLRSLGRAALRCQALAQGAPADRWSPAGSATNPRRS